MKLLQDVTGGGMWMSIATFRKFGGTRRPSARFSVANLFHEKQRRRQRQKRHERRMLALGRRCLWKSGEPTAGGKRRTDWEENSMHCDAAGWDETNPAPCERPSPFGASRATVMEIGENWLRRYVSRAVKCSQCGEREPVQPCGKPCQDFDAMVPF